MRHRGGAEASRGLLSTKYFRRQALVGALDLKSIAHYVGNEHLLVYGKRGACQIKNRKMVASDGSCYFDLKCVAQAVSKAV